MKGSDNFSEWLYNIPDHDVSSMYNHIWKSWLKRNVAST